MDVIYIFIFEFYNLMAFCWVLDLGEILIPVGRWSRFGETMTGSELETIAQATGDSNTSRWEESEDTKAWD